MFLSLRDSHAEWGNICVTCSWCLHRLTRYESYNYVRAGFCTSRQLPCWLSISMHLLLVDEYFLCRFVTAIDCTSQTLAELMAHRTMAATLESILPCCSTLFVDRKHHFCPVIESNDATSWFCCYFMRNRTCHNHTRVWIAQNIDPHANAYLDKSYGELHQSVNTCSRALFN